MNRRELFEGVGLAGMAAVSSAFAADAPAAPHEHHDHASMGGANPALVASASHCVATGDACLAHCISMLGAGDKELADCAKTVQDLIAACNALAVLAAVNSPHLPKFAAVVAEICTDCETECKKHEKHKVCRDCGSACATCAKECQTVVGA